MAAPRSGTDGGDTLAAADTEEATLIDLRGNGSLTGGPAADEMSGGAGNDTLAGGTLSAQEQRDR
jgi:Ca2+-binding RTX toxin-like protein